LNDTELRKSLLRRAGVIMPG